MKSQADPEISIMLVGNKLDKAGDTNRKVTRAEAEEFAARNEIMFSETSALSDMNVTSAFETLLNKIDEVKIRNPNRQGGVGGHGLGGAAMTDFEDEDKG